MPRASPADLRLRPQCEAVIEPTGKRRRIVRFESLRGEEWASAAIAGRKEGVDIGGADRLLEVRYAKDQRNSYERAAANALRRLKTTSRRTGRMSRLVFSGDCLA